MFRVKTVAVDGIAVAEIFRITLQFRTAAGARVPLGGIFGNVHADLCLLPAAWAEKAVDHAASPPFST